MVDVAQLVRAPVCGTGGRGFKSRHPPHIKCLELLEILSLISKHFLFPLAKILNGSLYFGRILLSSNT